MSRHILIKNGRVIDPANNIDTIMDVLIEGERIIRTEPDISPPRGARIIDASDTIVCPGFIDMHCHLREPGYEDKETIASGTTSAAAGGFTVVCTMPNTIPVIDSQTGVKFILDRARTTGKIKVLPIAAVTRGSLGEEITEFGDLVAHGAIGFSDDGLPVKNAEILRRAMEYTSMFNVPVMDHCEDLELTGDGVMYEGKVSTLLGLKGIPSAAESTIVARDLELAEFTGGWIHICHLSVARSVELIRAAKRRGVKVTAEVTPHHLTLTDEAVRTTSFDTNTKVKPPLSSEHDRQALIQGLLDDTIDVIVTDHAPHTAMEKDKPFVDAPFGVIGFETAFSVIYTELVM
ncbi:dihydroorotase, partial [Candidatus Sumerlaeota bacterium]|nr:dihydroorotase [Candidatus Sumerlaeota bacterium]